MLVFCDESWKADETGQKIGTLAALAIPSERYNAVEDRMFQLAQKYFGVDNARGREIKGKQLLSAYEYAREARGEVSLKLSFARELLEEMRFQRLMVFASLVEADEEVDLLCEDPTRLDRPYVYLMERIELAARETEGSEPVSVVFDDRGIAQNELDANASELLQLGGRQQRLKHHPARS